MKKRALSSSSAGEGVHQYKKARGEVYSRIASKEDAGAVDSNPPLEQLLRAVDKSAIARDGRDKKGECVVYWMRMEDLRSTSR